jgi:hypothetical protein
LKELDEANKEAYGEQKEEEKAERELDRLVSEAEKGQEYYRSHGCTYQGNGIWRCPPGTPDYVPNLFIVSFYY